jgi:hypothetical protein
VLTGQRIRSSTEEPQHPDGVRQPERRSYRPPLRCCRQVRACSAGAMEQCKLLAQAWRSHFYGRAELAKHCLGRPPQKGTAQYRPFLRSGSVACCLRIFARAVPGSLTKGGGINECDTREPDAGARFSSDGGAGPVRALLGKDWSSLRRYRPRLACWPPAPPLRQYQQIAEWSCKSGAAGRCGRGTRLRVAAVFKSWNTVQRYRRLMAAMLRCGR